MVYTLQYVGHTFASVDLLGKGAMRRIRWINREKALKSCNMVEKQQENSDYVLIMFLQYPSLHKLCDRITFIVKGKANI